MIERARIRVLVSLLFLLVGIGLPLVTVLFFWHQVVNEPNILAILFGSVLFLSALTFSGHRRLAVEVLLGKNSASQDRLYDRTVFGFLAFGLILVLLGFLDLLGLLGFLK